MRINCIWEIKCLSISTQSVTELGPESLPPALCRPPFVIWVYISVSSLLYWLHPVGPEITAHYVSSLKNIFTTQNYSGKKQTNKQTILDTLVGKACEKLAAVWQVSSDLSTIQSIKGQGNCKEVCIKVNASNPFINPYFCKQLVYSDISMKSIHVESVFIAKRERTDHEFSKPIQRKGWWPVFSVCTTGKGCILY